MTRTQRKAEQDIKKAVTAIMKEYPWMSAKEAIELHNERTEWAKRDRLRKRITELNALDTTEYRDLCDSSHLNALDTCEEKGQPRDTDSTLYLEMYVATLSMLLDEAGIAH